MTLPSCQDHGRIPRYDCKVCDAVRYTYRNPEPPLRASGGVTGLCSECRLPVVDWNRHRAWHKALGGTEQFDIGKYDRLMEVRG